MELGKNLEDRRLIYSLDSNVTFGDAPTARFSFAEKGNCLNLRSIWKGISKRFFFFFFHLNYSLFIDPFPSEIPALSRKNS